ncbi:MAG: AtpZ/AtpI family protein [Clostridia bacterium]|nr:AtpZ/AtpI family protein [Clostridia bacterium]
MVKKTNTILKNFRLGQIAISLGINFALWSFVGFFLGSRLDTRLGTEPWFMILGILTGIGFTFYGFIKEIMVLGDMEKKDRLKENAREDTKKDAADAAHAADAAKDDKYKG